jgi:hypothetical protein
MQKDSGPLPDLEAGRCGCIKVGGYTLTALSDTMPQPRTLPGGASTQTAAADGRGERIAHGLASITGFITPCQP